MYFKKVMESVQYLKNKINKIPDIAIILGSGLGNFAEYIEDRVIIPYSEIPNFPKSTAKGHKGNLICGQLENRYIAVFQGRFHLYEGYSINDVVIGIRTIGLLGVNKLIVTNAAGGISSKLMPGDLMIINDHINLSNENPAIGKDALDFGERFFDMTYAYDQELIEKARIIYNKNNIEYKEGVYAFLKGPSFETPAEIRMLKTLGADAVGMSTVPEVIAARQLKMRVLGISCITNMAAGILDQILTDKEVFEIAKKSEGIFTKLLKEIIDII
ncbi:purine-nucleoside phosphorylase [Caldicellulosiruptoraceae bacterium PP1]